MTLIGRGAELRAARTTRSASVRYERNPPLPSVKTAPSTAADAVASSVTPDFSGLMVMCCSRDSFRSTAIRANP